LAYWATVPNGDFLPAPICHHLSGVAMTQTPPYPLPAVAALIVAPDNRVLLVRTSKWSGYWGVPGGKIDYGEEMLTALKREMREETGLEIEAIEFAFVSQIINDSLFYKAAHFISFEYIARSQSLAVVPNEEIVEWQWLPLAEALCAHINPYTKQLLEYIAAGQSLGYQMLQLEPQRA
jgi:nucleoside triphosphatase